MLCKWSMGLNSKIVFQILVCKNWQRLSRESWRTVKSLCLAKIAPHKKKPKHVDILPSLKRATLALTYLDIGDYSWEQPIDEFYTMICM